MQTAVTAERFWDGTSIRHHPVILIEDGRIAHDVRIDIPRPRRRGSADLAALEGSILRDLLGAGDESSDI